MSQEGSLCFWKEITDAFYNVPLLIGHRVGRMCQICNCSVLNIDWICSSSQNEVGKKKIACFRKSIALQKLRMSLSILPCSLVDL